MTTITDYLAEQDYYLDPEAADGGWIKASKRMPSGCRIVAHSSTGSGDWTVIQFTKHGLIGARADFQSAHAPSVIAYIRELEKL